jgi:hypothetical protein
LWSVAQYEVGEVDEVPDPVMRPILNSRTPYFAFYIFS